MLLLSMQGSSLCSIKMVNVTTDIPDQPIIGIHYAANGSRLVFCGLLELAQFFRVPDNFFIAYLKVHIPGVSSVVQHADEYFFRIQAGSAMLTSEEILNIIREFKDQFVSCSNCGSISTAVLRTTHTDINLACNSCRSITPLKIAEEVANFIYPWTFAVEKF